MISEDLWGESTASLGSLCFCSITCVVQSWFLVFRTSCIPVCAHCPIFTVLVRDQVNWGDPTEPESPRWVGPDDLQGSLPISPIPGFCESPCLCITYVWKVLQNVPLYLLASEGDIDYEHKFQALVITLLEKKQTAFYLIQQFPAIFPHCSCTGESQSLFLTPAVQRSHIFYKTISTQSLFLRKNSSVPLSLLRYDCSDYDEEVIF